MDTFDLWEKEQRAQTSQEDMIKQEQSAEATENLFPDLDLLNSVPDELAEDLQFLQQIQKEHKELADEELLAKEVVSNQQSEEEQFCLELDAKDSQLLEQLQKEEEDSTAKDYSQEEHVSDLQPNVEEVILKSFDEEVSLSDEISSESSLENKQEYSYFSTKNKCRFNFGRSYFLALDIGHHSLKYVKVRKHGESGVIENFGIVQLSADEGEDAIVAALKKVQNEVKLKSLKIVTSLYGLEVNLKRISLPTLTGKELKEAVGWTARKQFVLEETPAVVDYQIVGQSVQKTVEHHDILMVAATETVVNSHLRPFEKFNFVPHKLAPLPVYLWNLYQKAAIQTDEDCVGLVDLGANKTAIAIIREGKLEFSREISTGGNDIIEAMTGTVFYEGVPYQLTREEAESVFLEYGFQDDSMEKVTAHQIPVAEIAVLMRPVLERLANEVQRSIDYYRESFSVKEVQKVYLVGGVAQTKNLKEFFQNTIETQVETFQFSTHFPLNLNETDAKVFHSRFLELAVAVGMAFDFSPTPNLLPEPLRKIEKIRLQKRLLGYSFLIVFIILGFLSATTVLRNASLTSRFQELKLQYQKYEPMKRRYDALIKQKNYLLNKQKVYREELVLDNPMPQLLKMISNLYPSRLALYQLAVASELPYSAKQSDKKAKSEPSVKLLHLRGICYRPSAREGLRIADFMMRLEESGYFSKVSLVSQHFDELKNELTFEIVCQF